MNSAHQIKSELRAIVDRTDVREVLYSIALILHDKAEETSKFETENPDLVQLRETLVAQHRNNGRKLSSFVQRNM